MTIPPPHIGRMAYPAFSASTDEWINFAHHPAGLAAIVATVLVGLAAVFQLKVYVEEYLAERDFARRYGCKPANRWPYTSLTLGLNVMRTSFKAAAEHKLLEMLDGRLNRFGPTFYIRMLNRRTLTTMDKDNVKTILSEKFEDFELADRWRTMGPLLGAGIFTTNGTAWRNSRDLVKPNFDRKQVANIHSFEKLFRQMLKLIPTDGTTVDLQELFFRITIDSATEFLFGSSTRSLETALATGKSSDSAFAVAFNEAQKDAAVKFRLSSAARFYWSKKEAQNIEICHKFVDNFVDQALMFRETLDEKRARHGDGALDEKEEQYVFLHELAKSTKNRVQLRSELLNILLAGRDTTASLLSNLWFVIAKRPDIFAKLKAETDEELKGELPTFEKLRSLKYLRYAIQESLRLHPVVPLNTRVAIRNTFLPRGGGQDGMSPVFVPKGVQVGYSVYAMHRRKDYFGPDADEFKPERWETLRQGWHYLPFNGGPRICVGQQYALTESSFVTVRLLQSFSRIESRDPGPWEESLHLTLSSHNGTKVALYK